jgi:hypothetical protein
MSFPLIFQYAPDWADMKRDAWAMLAAMWVGQDAEFKAVSERNKKNRGNEGTHIQGNRNHDRYKKHVV